MFKEECEQKDGKMKTKIIIQENRYKIGKQVGSGTFGKVYEGTDMKTNKKIAIKEVFQDKKYKNRQLDVISTLKHQNIIEMKDYYFLQYKEDKYLYLVMDCFQSNLQALLKQYRKQKKFLEPNQRKVLAFQLFKALAYLKEHKVCHRDLKPPNVLINPQTLQLRICDFGSAKIFNKIQKNVAYICSRYYRAPELLFNYTMYGTEVDVWSAGCILVELLTREPIFPGDSALQQLIQIIKVLGTPNNKYVAKYTQDYGHELNLPQIPSTSWEKVLKKYKPQPQLIDLISRVLVYDTKMRLTPVQALKHPYFHDLCTNEYKTLVDKLPNLLKFDSMMTQKNSKQIQQLSQLYNKPKQPIKGVTSIEIQLYNNSKLETGDSTPLIQNRAQQNRQYKCRVTKPGSSSDSIQPHTGVQAVATN